MPETHLPQNLGPNSQNGNDGGNDADSRAGARSSATAATVWFSASPAGRVSPLRSRYGVIRTSAVPSCKASYVPSECTARTSGSDEVSDDPGTP
ncbi:MAG: hypothetical protein E7K06_04095 [Corynebacterium sp.]|uniref:hypothetical protein n=2 Tax=Corynebacteriaceae TaxID=1653 RepID=UPI001E3FDA17|nr:MULTISPECIES: hypothetical protein [unclassified Corynebacterium]MDU3164677.1 hypothetical protein [Corynebacterium sp.]MDU6417823.1 hypothetical protein [Corynebacterium sp.]MDU6593233.1 hypothetical protein [Corynebacterium sp.]MDU7736881.1 hypothetical protein [Corynebacterium sp.]MDU7790136.1 hypothetical protein [Corynebacterium sp.]